MSKTTGTAEQILSLPKGGGAVSGLGETFQPDFHTGTGSYSIPLDIPNGPGDIAPKLALHYQTTGGQGPFGYGFGLSQLAVKRSIDKRIPTFTDADPLIVAGGGQLARAGDGSYRLNPDTNGWIIDREGEGFRITDNGGKYYRLGTSGDTRQSIDIGGSEAVYSWAIAEIEDPLGFKVSYSYLHDGNVLYPERIDYSIYSVRFYYEERPDPFVSRRAGFAETTRLRCTHIELEVAGEANPVARRWELIYAPAQASGHSFLHQVKLTGFDNSGESASVPVLTLSYTSFQPRTLERVRAESPDAQPGAMQQGTRELIDWNGNGLPDLLEIGGGTARVWQNKGSLIWGRPRSIGQLPVAVSLGQPGTAFADMEGNGTADLIMLDRPLAGYYPHKAKGGFEKPVFWRHTPNVRLSDPNVRLVDLNSDGIADLLVTGEDFFSLYYRELDGEWAARPVLIPRSEAPPVSLEDQRVHLADMTGDGLQDLVRIDGSGVVYWPYLGSGRWDEPVVMANSPELPRLYDPTRMFLTDVDGDGCADLVYVGTDRVTYWMNVNGYRLADPQEIRFTPLALPGQVRLADMNGTGTAGVLWSINRPGSRTTDYYYLDFAGNAKPHLLNRIDNGMGLVTEIEYGTSTSQAVRDESIGEAWPTFLPFPIPVILSLSTHDQVSDSPSLTRFRYHDGHYDGVSREFCGFGRVEIEETGDESIPTMLTCNRYHLGLDPDQLDRPLPAQQRARLKALRGKLLATEVYGADGTDKENEPYMKTSSIWDVHVEPLAEGAENVVEQVSPRLLERRTAYYEREAEPYRITVNLNKAFDAAGNAILQEERAEDPRQPVLNRTLITETAYAVDPAARFRGKPSRTVQRDGSGSIVSATISYYDGLPESEIGAAGLLTGQETLVLTDELAAAVYGAAVPDFAALGYHRRVGESGWWINQVSYTRTEEGGVLRGTTTNARGNATLLEFDAHRIQPVHVTDALGNKTSALLDYRTNKVSTLTDASGVVIMNHYDPLGRLLYTIEPGASAGLPTIRYSYPAADAQQQFPVGLVTEQRLENGKIETLMSKTFISGSGQTIEQRSVAGNQETVESSQLYSVRNLIKKQFLPFLSPGPAYSRPDAIGIPHRQFCYDAIGRLVEAINPDGALQKQAFEPGIAYMYDEEDARTEAGAQHASTPTRHTFDPSGRIMEAAVNDAGNWISTFYSYDIKGNLLAVTDGTGSKTTFFYDFLGRRLLTSNPVTGKSVFVFDAGGNQVEKRDESGARVQFEFDKLDRLFRTTLPETGALSAAFTYDDAGQAMPPEGDGNSKGKIVRIEHGAGSEVLAYDGLGRVKHRELYPNGLAGQKFEFDYTYRATGQIESITYPKPTAATGRLIVRYSYDQRGRLSAIPGFVKKISYTAAGLRESIAYANGVTTTYVYDNLSLKLVQLRTVDGGGTVLQQLDYQYDRVGNLLEVDSPDPKLAASYVYDNLYRLVEAGTVSGSQWTYHYDSAGNLTNKSDVGAYSYDAAGRLTAAGPHGFTYTNTGQTETGPWGTASYDAIGRLAAVARGAEQMACTYNHEGSRVRMHITGGAEEFDQWTLDELLTIQNGTAIGYIMDGSVRVAQLALAAGTASFLHGDHLGSTALVTGMDGAVLQRVHYDPFGAVLTNTIEAGAEGTTYLYTGANYDQWSELLYCQSRYYDPRIGRFLTPDTMVPELYNPQAWNRFSYVQNNPLRYTDPSGHFWEEIGQWFEDNWKQIVAAVAVVAVIVLAVVLSIVTFGIAGIIAVGIGMAIGGVVGGVSAAAAGGDVLLGVLCGMAVGGAAALGGMGIGAGMAAAFGAKTLAATLLTGALAGAVNGAAMGFTAGFAGGQGSIGEIWEKMLEGALVGAITGVIMGFGSYLFGGGTLGTGKLSIPKPSTAALGKAAVGFAAGSLAELGREAAAGNGLDPMKILGAGVGGAGLGAFVSFGGSSGLPVLDFLKPTLTGAVSGLFAQGVSAVFVLDYADDLWKFILQNDMAKVSKSGKFNYP